MPPGRRIRCAGFSLDYVVFCTREEHAGGLLLDIRTEPPAYRHALFGHCGCGAQHGTGHARPAEAKTIARIVKTGAPLSDRDAVYGAALDLLDLRSTAVADLARRGLSPEAILRYRFRSIPRKGSEQERFMRAMVSRLGEPTLRRVPGFRDKNDRLTFWTAVGGRDGYVIPYLDEAGRITGIQLRLLGNARKRYLSALNAVAGVMYHLAGEAGTARDLFAVEGGLKATVAAELGDYWCIGVPGQSLSDYVVRKIASLHPGRVLVALDREPNETTEKARQAWLRKLWAGGLPVAECVWEGAR